MSNEVAKISETDARDAVTSDVEEQLSSLLGLKAGTRLDPRKPFRLMGLDSLLAVDLLIVLEKKYGELPESVFDDHPTLEQLTEYLVHSRNTASD